MPSTLHRVSRIALLASLVACAAATTASPPDVVDASADATRDSPIQRPALAALLARWCPPTSILPASL